MAEAHAPYNFIPLNSSTMEAEPFISHDQYHDDRKTGYFDVKLTAETPLFVRGMLNKKEYAENQDKSIDQKDKHKQSHFFMPDGENPVIPGSSLRGMIRNLYEIITFGKMHFVSDDLLLYRSVFGDDVLVNLYRSQVNGTVGNNNRHMWYPNQRLKGGYLVKDNRSESGWSIQPAVEHNKETFVLVTRRAIEDNIDSDLNPRQVKHKTHRPIPVWVQPTERKTHNSRVILEVAEATKIGKDQFSNAKSAILIFSQTVDKRRWYPAIFEKDSTVKSIEISKKTWNTYVEDRDLNKGIPTRKIERSDDPLFYLVDDNDKLIFLGPTMFFRLPYENSIGDLINGTNYIDYTDAVFGYVHEQPKQARAGRISVTSATLLDGSLFDESEPIIRTQGSPKPTTFQHYLDQPQGHNTRKRDLHHYGNRQAKLRGHKLYWRQDVDIEKLKNNNLAEFRPRLDTKMYPIIPADSKEKLQFTFKVYFENLTDAELGALAWVMTLGHTDKDKDSYLYHMLGMGKPYGMGVVKLDAKLILSDRKDRYSSLFKGIDNSDEYDWNTGESKNQDMSDYIQKFRDTCPVDDFDNHSRIKELMAMLKFYQPHDDLKYMDLGQFRPRPVLPSPSIVSKRLTKIT